MPAVSPASPALPVALPGGWRPLRRGLVATLTACGLLLIGCASAQPVKEPPPSTELELAYDSGPASERPLLPPAGSEWLVKFDPGLPAYQPHRLRLLVAQPGPVRIAVYSADTSGRPGEALRTLDRVYTPEQTSNGQDGKWLLEPLFDLPKQTAPLFIGLSVPSPGPGAARLWATAADASGPAHVFARDPEPATALQSTRLPITPMLRLALIPVAAPPPPAPPAAAPTAPAAAPTGQAGAAPAAAPTGPAAAAPGPQ